MSRTLSVTISEATFLRLVADAGEEGIVVHRQAELLLTAGCRLLELTGAAHIDDVSPLALREAVDAAHCGAPPRGIAERNASPVVRQVVRPIVRRHWDSVDAALAFAAANMPTRSLTARLLGDPEPGRRRP